MEIPNLNVDCLINSQFLFLYTKVLKQTFSEQVHIADGKFFIKKSNLVKVEKAQGLRPRLKKLLAYMYGKDLPYWHAGRITKKTDKNMKEIPVTHIQAFCGMHNLLVFTMFSYFTWHNTLNQFISLQLFSNVFHEKKETELSHEQISREISKAASELKSDGYPCSEEEEKSGKTSEEISDSRENKESALENKESEKKNDDSDNATRVEDESFYESDNWILLGSALYFDPVCITFKHKNVLDSFYITQIDMSFLC